jgi:hypothetical protein
VSETIKYYLGEKGCPYRQKVAQAVLDADDDAIARIGPSTRSLEQNSFFHAALGDLSKQCKHFGRTLLPAQWKVLVISGFSIVSGHGTDLIVGLESEMCNIRESSADMGVRRMAELITYVLAFGANYRDELGQPKPVLWTAPKRHMERF